MKSDDARWTKGKSVFDEARWLNRDNFLKMYGHAVEKNCALLHREISYTREIRVREIRDSSPRESLKRRVRATLIRLPPRKIKTVPFFFSTFLFQIDK